MKLLLNFLLALLILLYPVGVYFGLQHFDPKYIAIGLLLVVILRLLIGKKFSAPHHRLIAYSSLAIAAVIVIYSLVSTSTLGLKLYPVLMSFAFLLIFAFSLWKPPTIIESFARLQQPDLPSQAIVYTKKVTLIWCGFFIINIMISSYTVFYASDEMWTLYNGLISYLLMGSLFIGELAYRKWILKV